MRSVDGQGDLGSSSPRGSVRWCGSASVDVIGRHAPGDRWFVLSTASFTDDWLSAQEYKRCMGAIAVREQSAVKGASPSSLRWLMSSFGWDSG